MAKIKIRKSSANMYPWGGSAELNKFAVQANAKYVGQKQQQQNTFDGLSTALPLVGDAIGSIVGDSNAATMISDVTSLAGAGAAFGPIGMGIGGALGAVKGIADVVRRNKEERRMKLQQHNAEMSENVAYGADTGMNPFVSAYGGLIEQMYAGGVPIQAEKFQGQPEYYQTPNNDLEKTNATRSHEAMGNEPTDVVPDNSFVFSARNKYSKKEWNLLLQGMNAQGQQVSPGIIEYLTKGTNKKKISPADMAERVDNLTKQKASPTIFSDASAQLGERNKVYLLEQIKKLNQAVNPEQQGANTNTTPQAAWGGRFADGGPAYGCEQCKKDGGRTWVAQETVEGRWKKGDIVCAPPEGKGGGMFVVCGSSTTSDNATPPNVDTPKFPVNPNNPNLPGQNNNPGLPGQNTPGGKREIDMSNCSECIKQKMNEAMQLPPLTPFLPGKAPTPGITYSITQEEAAKQCGCPNHLSADTTFSYDECATCMKELQAADNTISNEDAMKKCNCYGNYTTGKKPKKGMSDEALLGLKAAADLGLANAMANQDMYALVQSPLERMKTELPVSGVENTINRNLRSTNQQLLSSLPWNMASSAVIANSAQGLNQLSDYMGKRGEANVGLYNQNQQFLDQQTSSNAGARQAWETDRAKLKNLGTVAYGQAGQTTVDAMLQFKKDKTTQQMQQLQLAALLKQLGITDITT